MAKVKLTHPALVHGSIRQAGEIVELADKLAPHFGEVLEKPTEKPKKKTKEKNEE